MPKYLECKLGECPWVGEGCAHTDGNWCKSGDVNCKAAGEVIEVPFGISCGTSDATMDNMQDCSHSCDECLAIDIKNIEEEINE